MDPRRSRSNPASLRARPKLLLKQQADYCRLPQAKRSIFNLFIQKNNKISNQKACIYHRSIHFPWLKAINFDQTIKVQKQRHLNRNCYKVMKAKESIDILAKIIIIGDSGVGKTNLILSFVGQKFKENYVATIGVDFKAKTLQLEGKKVKLQIWDTAGQQRYRTITETYYKGASGIILTYSIADRSSFENLNAWIHQITEKAPPGIPKIIFANKKDLQNTSRVVTTEQGIAMAEKYSTPNCKIFFHEVSAKTGQGVEQAFFAICQKVKQQFQAENIIKPVIKIATEKAKSEEEQSCKC